MALSWVDKNWTIKVDSKNSLSNEGTKYVTLFATIFVTSVISVPVKIIVLLYIFDPIYGIWSQFVVLFGQSMVLEIVHKVVE